MAKNRKASVVGILVIILFFIIAPPANAVDISHSCNVYQGFNLQSDRQDTVGFIESIKIGDYQLDADLSVTDPMDVSKSIKVVGIVSDIYWAGGYYNPIQFSCRVSEANKTTIAALTQQSLENTNVELIFSIYAYDPDPEAKVYFKCFHTNSCDLRGLIEQKGSTLLITIDTEPSTDVTSPQNFTFVLSIVPQNVTQSIYVATSSTQKLQKQWGIGVSCNYVTFNSNGGTEIHKQTVVYGDTVAKPAAPTKPGYTFDNWYQDAGLTAVFNFGTIITADTTLYAKWIPIDYTVTIGSLTAGSIVADRATATIGTVVNLTIVPDTGRQLKAGTLKYNDGIQDTIITGTSFTMPAANVSVTAEFEEVSVITAASVTGVAAPVTGAVPIAVGALTAGEASYTVTSITWQNSDGSPATLTEGQFNADSTYQAVLVLTSATGYKFQASGLTLAANAGTSSTGTAGGGDGSGNTLTFTLTFPATAPMLDECFIATAAYGSKFTWPVSLLRHFRDQYLLTNSWGAAFVEFYYHHSPPVAAMIATSQPLKMLVRVMLAPVIAVVYIIYHPILMVTVLYGGFLIYRYKLRRRCIQV